MQKIIFYFLFLYLCKVHSGYSVQKSKHENPDYKAFFNTFSLVDSVNFEQNNLIIGQITHLAVQNEYYIIWDNISDSMFSVFPKTKKWYSLNIEKFLPGNSWSPISHWSDIDMGYWIANFPHYYIKLDSTGVNRVLNLRDLPASGKLAVSKDNHLYIIQNSTPKASELIIVNLANEKIVQKFTLPVPSEYQMFTYRALGYGGIAVGESNQIYYANPVENKIYCLDQNGTIIDIFQSNYTEFKTLPRDNERNSNTKDLLKYLSLTKTDLVSDIQIFNKNYLIARYSLNKRLCLEIFDLKTGSPIHREKIMLPYHFGGINGKLLYLKKSPDKGSNLEDIKNPSLYIFEIKR